MKTQKIFKKFKELNLTSKITLQSDHKVSADINKSSLSDSDLERILRVFPPKKYNISIKTGEGKMILEIDKVQKFNHFMDCGFPPLTGFFPRDRHSRRIF